LIDENGNEVSKELAYVDTYAYKPAKVRVGTGAPAAPVWEDPGAAAAPPGAGPGGTGSRRTTCGASGGASACRAATGGAGSCRTSARRLTGNI
jgi:hypothetical protein